MSALRAGVIGLGVGMRHAEVYASHPGCELAAVCDLDQAKLDQARERFPGAETFKEANHMWGLGLDVVSVASYDDAHHEQILAALESGAHVFAEKPLCQTEAQARDIRQALDKTGLRLSSNLPLRAEPRFAAVHRAARAGELGQIPCLNADYLWGRTAKLTEGWRKDMDFYSIIQGGAVHMIDLALWLKGARPVSVSGLGGRSDTVRGSAMRFNDWACLQLRFPDGSAASVSVHGGAAHPHFHCLAVYGTKGSFVQDLPGAAWTGPDGSVRPEERPYPDRKRRGLVLSSFLDSLAGPDVPPLVGQQDVFDTMCVCFAADQAVDSGRTVDINYL